MFLLARPSIVVPSPAIEHVGEIALRQPQGRLGLWIAERVSGPWAIRVAAVRIDVDHVSAPLLRPFRGTIAFRGTAKEGPHVSASRRPASSACVLSVFCPPRLLGTAPARYFPGSILPGFHIGRSSPSVGLHRLGRLAAGPREPEPRNSGGRGGVNRDSKERALVTAAWMILSSFGAKVESCVGSRSLVASSGLPSIASR